MSIFRLQENVPDVYVNQSRDFQLLCNSFDAVYNAVKYDIDSIVCTADTKLCSDKLLPLLQTKLGFFSKYKFNTNELRIVLQAFPYIVKHKGSRKGIIAAIEVFFKVINASRRCRVTLVEKPDIDSLSKSYCVLISIEGTKVNTALLTEILHYVVPAGYSIQYSFYKQSDANEGISVSHALQTNFANIKDSRAIRTSDSSSGLYGVTTSVLYRTSSSGDKEVVR